MALSFTLDNNHKVDLVSSAAVNNLAQGSILLWLNIDSLPNTNAIKRIVSKGVGGEIEIRKQTNTDPNAPNGLAILVRRATAPQSVQIASASLTTGAWGCIAFTWDITNGGPLAYAGNLTTNLADVSVAPVNGSGSKNDDSGSPFGVGDSYDETFSLGMDLARLMVFNTDLAAADLIAQQFNPDPYHPNLVLWNELGQFPESAGTQLDLSGKGHTGTVTGATQAAHPAELLAPFHRFARRAGVK